MPRLSFSRIFALVAAATALLVLSSTSPLFAQTASPPAPTSIESIVLQLKQPMQFVHVVSADPSCQSNCPEWISAEGTIMIGTAQTFARVIAGLRGKRLAILISSPGGSMPDAMAMGRLIRAQHLAVAVARTEMSPCPANQPKCAPARGLAKLASSICMSACPAVLAGGVERYVSGLSPVGVHQVKLGPKTMVKRLYKVQYRIVDGRKEEISRTLVSQEQSTIATTSLDLSSADSAVGKYLAEMGVGDSIIKAMLATPSTRIDLLTNAELASSRLATQWLMAPPFVRNGSLEGTPTAP